MYSRFNSAKSNFPDSKCFSKINKVLYIGTGEDVEGLEELVKKYQYVVGIDNDVCNNPEHFHNQYGNKLERKNKLNIKEMDARKLDFSNESFDGVIFKRSLAFIGGYNKIKNEGEIRKALNETNRVLCRDGLIWIIYSEADVKELTINRINILLKSTGFETMEDKEYFRVCRKLIK